MDQQSGDTADKRNWRERLGIGKNAAASDLPKLSSEFKDEGAAESAAPRAPAPRPAAVAHTPVKAAPMAPRTPRAGAAPAAPRVATPVAAPAPASPPRQAPVAPDALASKLRDQREAAERLAQQRIQAAKARAEAVNQSNQPPAPAAAKPKFTFADQQDANPAARPATPWPPAGVVPNPRPAAQPPAAAPRPQFPPQMQPPRPQLGGATTPPPAYPPAGQQPSYGQGGGYGQSYQPPYNPGYSNPYGQQPPSYRPIDPNSGYAPPSGFNPQAPRGNPPAGARLSPPPRGPSYTPAGQQPPQLQIGPALDPEADGDDIFEAAPQRSGGRRATANDYNQAYQDGLDYDEAPQRSGSFGMILGLLLLGLLVAFAVVFGYSHFIKNQPSSGAAGNVPVVNAPATPTKSTPDANTSQQGDAANKKLIYDRIEGDHEVPGGPLKSTEQAPAATQQGGDAQQGGGATNGDASQPVPLPPPPGGNNGQQGALSPDANSSVANAIPAAGQNPAANSSQGGASSQAGGMNVTPTSAAPDAKTGASAAAPSGGQAATQDALIPAPPAPGETPSAKPAAATSATADDSGDEQIGNTKAKPAKPATKTVTAETAKADTAKTKSLGGSPVVLVPPSKTAATQTAAAAPIMATKPTTPVAASSGGGLYGDSPVAAAPQQMASAAPQAPVVAAPSAVAPKAGTGAYVVKLSSFGSREEATQEYQRLSAKHGALITRYAPIVTQSTVAGSVRYNLNLGPMASNDVASSVCSSLIAAGERDCAVQRQ